jgi:hypothetical protein
LQLLDSRPGGEGRDSFPDDERAAGASLGRSSPAERRPALSSGGGGGPIDDDIPF